MQTLIFRTSKKTTTLYSDKVGSDIIPDFSFSDVSTVAIRPDGFYEIMIKSSSIQRNALPVARLPIANTNVLIVND